MLSRLALLAALALFAAQPAAAAERSVTVIGLGHMGSVLGKTLIDHGVKVTVWNRTASKAAPLAAAGAAVARTPAAAIASSPLILVSLLNKEVARSILDSPGVAQALKDRTLVDLSSGSAADARRNAALVAQAGGAYLDGGIMEYPRSIGAREAVIVYSGSAAAFHAHEPTLALLAGDQRYLGADPGTAATTYLALWNTFFVALAGYFEGAALDQAAGVGVGEFRSLARTMAQKFGDAVADANRRIGARDYAGDQAPVDEYLDFFEQIRQAESTAGVGQRGAEALIGYVQAAQKAGNGDKDIAVLFRTIGGRD